MASFCALHVQELRLRALGTCVGGPALRVRAEAEWMACAALLCLGVESDLATWRDGVFEVPPHVGVASMTLGTLRTLLQPLLALGTAVRLLDAATRRCDAANSQTAQAFGAQVRVLLVAVADVCLAAGLAPGATLLQLVAACRPYAARVRLCSELAVHADPGRLLDALERRRDEYVLLDAAEAVYVGALLEATAEPYRRITWGVLRDGVVRDPCNEYFVGPDWLWVAHRPPPRALHAHAARIVAIGRSLMVARSAAAFSDGAQPLVEPLGAEHDQGGGGWEALVAGIARRDRSVCGTLVTALLCGPSQGLEAARVMRAFFCLETPLVAPALLRDGAAATLERSPALRQWLCAAPDGTVTVPEHVASTLGPFLCGPNVILTYNGVQKFLLMLYQCRARLSSGSLPLRDKRCEPLLVCCLYSTYLLTRFSVAALAFRQRALWVMGSLLDAASGRLHDESWNSVAVPTLTSARDPDALASAHALYVQRLGDICFLGARPLLGAIQQLAHCCSMFDTHWNGNGVDLAPLAAAFEQHLHLLRTLLAGLVAQRNVSYLAGLLSALE